MLRRKARLMASIALLMCLAMVPFAGAFVFLPVAVAAAAWSYRWIRARGAKWIGP